MEEPATADSVVSGGDAPRPGSWTGQAIAASWLTLPSDRGRCGDQASRLEVEVRPGPQFGRTLAAAASELGVSPRDVALASFVALLQRHAHQPVVSVGVWDGADVRGEAPTSPAAVRVRVVSCEIGEETRLAELAGAVARELDRHAPSVEAGSLERMDVTFGRTHDEHRAIDVGSDRAGNVALTVLEAADGWTLRLAFDGRSFRDDRMRELLAQYQRLAEQAARSPADAVLGHSLVTDLGRRLIPDPSQPIVKPRYPLLTESFLACAGRRPDDIAVSRAGRTWTYAELARSSTALARHLRRVGVRPGQVVAVTGERSFAVVGSMLGVFLSGGTLLTLDPKLPLERRKMMMKQAGASRLVSVGEPGDLAVDGPEVVRVDAMSGAVAGAGPADETELPPLEPGAAAYVFFTSGSTGMPKAVLGTHEGLAHFLDWQRRTFEIVPSDRASQITTLSFDMVLRDMFLALTSGATLCIPAESDVLDPSAILDWMDAERVTVIHIVPSLLRAWLNHVPPGVRLPHLRRVFLAGEPLTDVLVNRFRASFGSGPLVTNFYGPTETTLIKCYHRVEGEPEPGVQPIGRAQPETQILILDRRRRLCGVNETGEIAIRTPFRTLGYLNAPEATAAAFIRNPFRDDPADLVYLTGDSGRYRTDGLLEIQGRIDNQVKIRGMRVEPGEIEALIGHHPDVREAAVTAHEDPVAGKYLAGYLVLKQGPAPVAQSAAIARVREFLRARLPENMVPTAFVVLEALPLHPNGKVNKKALPVPDRSATAVEGPLQSPGDAPANPREEELLAIWRGALGHQRVGVNDSFVELGGDSLTAIGALVRMQRLGIPDSVARGIFQGWSIRQIVSSSSAGSERGGEVAITPKARTNLLVNVVRGVLVALLVTDHYFEGFLNRLPERWQGTHEALLPLFSVATPGFALVFGLALGYIFLPRYQTDPAQAKRSLRVGMWLVAAGVLIRSGAEVAEALTAGRPLDSTAFFSTFYSALLYYLMALASAPLWFRIISKARNPYVAAGGLAVAAYVLHHAALRLLLEHEQHGFLQLCRLMAVAKFNYFNMSFGVLCGVVGGIWLHRWSQRNVSLRDLAPRAAVLGAAATAGGLLLLYVTMGSLSQMRNPGILPVWRWVFYAGTLLLFASLMSVVLASYEKMVSGARVSINLVAVLGQIALPMFVLHQLVLRVKSLLVHLGLPAGIALAIPLLTFLAITGWMMWKLYGLYYGPLLGGPVAAAEARGKPRLES